MNIHEYQGKALFKQHGVKVVEGVHCTSVSEALDARGKLRPKWGLKSMQGGEVKETFTLQEAETW